MTETATNPIVAQPVQQVQAPTVPTITQDIRDRVVAIGDELNAEIKERSEVVRGSLNALISQEHLLMLGPGGTGKSLLVRALVSHIEDSTYFEVALDETSDPSQVFGPPNIKEMVDHGRSSRVTDGMFPKATHAFLDELFNANGPLLHSLMPCLNERVFHDNGEVLPIPLRSVFAGTNKLNADADLAAMWDRVHQRHVVDYVSDRQSQADLVGEAIVRMAQNGRGTNTALAGANHSVVTLDELDLAHREALSLDIPEAVVEVFLDIRDELKNGSAKIQISDRRTVEGMAAVMANAWLNNHTSVTVGDLDVLASMWWTVQDQMSEARSVILAATNPGEKAALDLLDGLDDLKKEIKEANDSEMDPARKKRVGVSSVKSADKLLGEAKGYLAKAQAAGTSTTRLEQVIKQTEAFKVEVGRAIFGISADDMANLANANATP